MTTRLHYALAAVTLTIAMLPALGGCANLVGGCPITDDGVDDCPSGASECVDETTLRTCLSGGGCDAFWFTEKCPTGKRCTVQNNITDCF